MEELKVTREKDQATNWERDQLNAITREVGKLEEELPWVTVAKKRNPNYAQAVLDEVAVRYEKTREMPSYEDVIRDSNELIEKEFLDGLNEVLSVEPVKAKILEALGVLLAEVLGQLVHEFVATLRHLVLGKELLPGDEQLALQLAVLHLRFARSEAAVLSEMLGETSLGLEPLEQRDLVLRVTTRVIGAGHGWVTRVSPLSISKSGQNPHSTAICDCSTVSSVGVR